MCASAAMSFAASTFQTASMLLCVSVTATATDHIMPESSFARDAAAVAEKHHFMNSIKTGAMTCGFSMCVCRGKVRYVALGMTSAKARIALRIHVGLLPPSATSTGIVAAAHFPAGSGLPRLWS